MAEDPGVRRSRLGLAALMVGSGVLHFVAPAPYERITPRWVGDRRRAVHLSGAAELVCGGLLLAPRTHRAGGWLTAAVLVAVFPANVQMVVDAGTQHQAAAQVPTPVFRALGIARLPLQLPLVARALRVARAG
jgi:uncharacterized membrane protein